MPIAGTIDVRVGSVRDFVAEGGTLGAVAQISFVAVADDIGRFRARLDGIDGMLDEVYGKPGSGSAAPVAGYRLRIFDEDVDQVPGRVLVDEVDHGEGPIVVDRAIAGTLAVELTGMGDSKEISVSLWVI